MGNAALAAALLAVGTLYLVLDKNVTLVVDGRPVAVRTLSSNVGQLLDTRGIVLDGRDVVVPSVGTPLADGMTVVVDTGGFHSVSGVGAWVVDGVSGTLARLALLNTEDRFSAGGPVGPSRTVFAKVVVKGKAHDVMTNASTVRELLSAMGIEPDRSDRVLPSPTAPLHNGSLVRLFEVDVQTKRVMTSIPFGTYTHFSTRLPPGTVRIDQYGSPGRMVVLYRIKRVDGRVVRRIVLSRRVIEEAVPMRLVVGRVATTIHGTESGEASWYSFAPGSGFTAAHPWLPFGTVVTVTNVDTGKSIRVVINDRGPFGGRIIDLSDQAFAALAPLSQGVMDVRLTW